jgi:hypothetical protein
VPKSETQFIVVPSECKMTLKRRFRDEDIAQELILGCDCDTHIYDDISSQSNSDIEENDRTDTSYRDCTNTTQSKSRAPLIHKLTGGTSELRQNEAPSHKQRLVATEHFHALFS